MKCCFIGNRDVPNIDNLIYKNMLNLVLKNPSIEFYSGGMGNFDRACEIFAKLFSKKITLAAYNLSQIKQKDFSFYDSIFCPFGSKKYEKFDIPKRNKILVDMSDICFCYIQHPGGAIKTLNYAIKKRKTIIDLLSD